MKKRLGCIALIAVVTASASFALAADFPFDKEIKARQGMFQVAGFNLGILAAMVKGEREYNAELAAASAKNVHLASMIDQGAVWPEGSDTSNAALAGKTNAMPELWMNLPDVVKKHGAWTAASAKLAEAAGNGLDALKPALGEVGKTCKSCHDDYRQKS